MPIGKRLSWLLRSQHVRVLAVEKRRHMMPKYRAPSGVMAWCSQDLVMMKQAEAHQITIS